MIRDFLKKHPPRGRRQKLNDFIVAYFIPTYVWQRWACWFWEDEYGTTMVKARRAIEKMRSK